MPKKAEVVSSGRDYEEYLVAYFDILGFGNMVEHFSEYGVLDKYNQVLQSIRQKESKVEPIWASDSFVFYIKTDSKIIDIYNFVCAVGMFFREMFIKCIPMRGCLHIGEFYRDTAKNIFFGTAYNRACKLAEKQCWIGFVLTKEIEARLKQFIIEDSKSVWDWLEKQYDKYDVPCKKGKKESLQVFNFKLPNNQIPRDTQTLYNAIKNMENDASTFLHENEKEQTTIKKCRERKKVLVKYKNTKEFLLKAYPRLK